MTHRQGDSALYGSLRGHQKPPIGRKATTSVPAIGSSYTTRSTLLSDVRSASEPQEAQQSQKKPRAYSSRSRMLLLPSFEEAWRVEQAHYSNGNASSDSAEHVLEQSSWYHAAGIIVGEIIGSGILGLPGAFARLGFFIGTFCCVIFCLLSMYSGVLLARVRNFFYPSTESYADAAQFTWGTTFKSVTKYLVLLNWLFLLPYYLLTITKSLKLALENDIGQLCFYQFSLFAVAGLFIFLQFRTLSGIAYAAIVSDISIIVAITLILVYMDESPSFASHSLATTNTTGALVEFGEDSSSLLWPLRGTFLQIYGRTSTMVFAYQGQSIYYEIMREMKSSAEFPKAIFVASSVMGSIYAATCIISILTLGRNVPEFLPNAIPASHTIVRRVVGWLLSYHVLVSYILTNQPLASKFHAMLSPDTLLDYVTWRGKFYWLFITSALLTFSFLIANAIPFFSTFQALIGSLLGAPLMFGWPAFFYLSASIQQGRLVPCLDVALCLLFLIVFLPLCTVVGCISAIQNLISDWSNQGYPFQC